MGAEYELSTWNGGTLWWPVDSVRVMPRADVRADRETPPQACRGVTAAHSPVHGLIALMGDHGCIWLSIDDAQFLASSLIGAVRIAREEHPAQTGESPGAPSVRVISVCTKHETQQIGVEFDDADFVLTEDQASAMCDWLRACTRQMRDRRLRGVQEQVR